MQAKPRPHFLFCHHIERNAKLWAITDREDAMPREIIFDSLRPYNGFNFYYPGNPDLQSSDCEAKFALTREDYFRCLYEKLEDQISQINIQITKATVLEGQAPKTSDFVYGDRVQVLTEGWGNAEGDVRCTIQSDGKIKVDLDSNHGHCFSPEELKKI